MSLLRDFWLHKENFGKDNINNLDAKMKLLEKDVILYSRLLPIFNITKNENYYIEFKFNPTAKEKKKPPHPPHPHPYPHPPHNHHIHPPPQPQQEKKRKKNKKRNLHIHNIKPTMVNLHKSNPSRQYTTPRPTTP